MRPQPKVRGGEGHSLQPVLLTLPCEGHCEGWGSPIFPRCAVDKWLALLPLLTPPHPNAHLGSHPAPLPTQHSSSLWGPRPRSTRAEQQRGNHGRPCLD